MRLTACRRKDHKIAWIRGIPGFSDLSAGQLRRLAAVVDRAQVPAGRRLVAQGRRGLEAFVVTDGVVDVRRDGQFVARAGTGTVIGELALLDDAPRNAEVVAVTDVEVMVFDPRGFRRVLDENRHFRALVERSAAHHRVPA